ncbi:MAG: 30S ribosomal protein S14 [Acidobacteria bacterium]|nr:30S ribosomal protein S14 [Acidobacteriota bacterium]
MASQCKIAKNVRQERLIEMYREQRAELKAVWLDSDRSPEDREHAVRQLRKLPRDSSPTRYRNRCNITGRPRGYYRKFGISRIGLRELALRGELPGVIKASW